MKVFIRGDQIAYIPNHAFNEDGTPNFNHKDAQFGFVTSINQKTETIFCRYWIAHGVPQLRTTINSEGANPENIFPYVSLDQSFVAMAIINEVIPSEAHNQETLDGLKGLI